MENFENKKNLELGATNLSESSEVEFDSTTEGIIPQENYNEQEEYDPFDIAEEEISIEESIEEDMTEWEKIYFEMNISLDDGKEYDSEIYSISESNGILNIALNANKNGIIKSIKNSYFFTSKECMENTFRSITDLAKMFGITMERKNFKNINAIIETLKPLIGKKVVIVPKTRYDEKTGKSYQNYNVVKVLSNDYIIGGNK